MRKHFPIPLLVALTAAVVVAPSGLGADVELLATRDAVWRAWFTHDVATFNQTVTKDLIAMGAGQKEWSDRDATLAASERFVKNGGKLLRIAFPKTEVQRFGDVAVVYSTYELETETQGKRSTQAGRATEVFVWKGGRWEHPGWHLDTDN